MTKIKFKSLFVLLIISLVFWFQSCKDVTNPEDNAPTVPPTNTMVMDFTEFPDTSTIGPLPKMSVASYQNWGWAAFNVHYWNSLVTVTLAIPVAAFAEAFNHQPVLQGDGSWLWSYNFTAVGILHTAKLYGKPNIDGVDWRMLLTKTGEYTDFEWFTGTSNLPATEGTWTLNMDPADPKPFIFIEWERNVEQNTASVKYTNIIPSDPDNGSYIQYGKTTDVTYNRYYKIWSQKNSNLTDIVWNYENHFGSVNDPLHFGDPNQHCWDELLMDTDCQ